MSKFLHNAAIATPWVFSENSRAKNGGKFSKGKENTVGKGEIAHYEQFPFFFHSVFKRLILQICKNKGSSEKRIGNIEKTE